MTICMPSASSVALYYNLSKFNQNLSKNKLPGLLPQGREGFPVFPKISPKNVVFTPKMQFMEPKSWFYQFYHWFIPI